MNEVYYQIIFILLLHWIFDFKFQAHRWAMTKSKSFRSLAIHCAVYSLLAFMLFKPIQITLFIYSILFISHFIIDGITSRITSYLWKKQEIHYFFCVIGFDQILHYAILFKICQ
jgi:uncharacterized membrane protein HdeD (DUF308 family)